VAAASYCHVWLLIAFLERGLYCRHNTVIVLRINYVIIIVTSINNNAVIGKNYGRLQDLILLITISLGTGNIFFEIHREFGHAPSKKVASPGVEGNTNK
jgi:hypothetical protein